MSDKCCELCKFYAELKQPYTRSDKAVIYGYCFKLGDKNYSLNMGKGFPVFISGGVCESFKRSKKCQQDKKELDQLSMF